VSVTRDAEGDAAVPESSGAAVTLFTAEPAAVGHATVALVGELDVAGVDTLLAAVRPLLRPEHPEVVLDLRRLTYCDSSGMRRLQQLDHEARSTGVHLVLAGVPPRLRRIFDIVRFGDIVDLVDDVDVESSSP